MKTLAAILILAALAVATTAIALAHEDEETGDYSLVIGFLNEPAYEGEINAVSVRVTHVDDHATHSAEPDGVEGLDQTLQVEVTYVPTSTSKTMDLIPVYDDPGHYVAYLIPTAPGHYRFRLFGAIEGEEIDETFDSMAGGGNFDDVQTASAIHFPEPLPSVREIESAIRGVQEAQQAQQAQLAQQAQQTQQARLADDSDTDADAPLGIIGVATGVVGIVVGAAAMIVATRRKS